MPGVGHITETATAAPGYTSARPNSATPLAEILRQNGYNTAQFGKSHEVPTWESGPTGPFDRWPVNSGFEKFYGFVGGETNQWSPALIDGTTAIEPPHDPDYHLMPDLADKAIADVRQQKSLTPGGAEFETPQFWSEHLEEVGGPHAYNHYTVGWAHAMCTPYQWTKQVASHYGGTRNGTIVHWPAPVPEGGQVHHQWHHVIDFAPTVLDLPVSPSRIPSTASPKSRRRAQRSRPASPTRTPPRCATRSTVIVCHGGRTGGWS